MASYSFSHALTCQYTHTHITGLETIFSTRVSYPNIVSPWQRDGVQNSQRVCHAGGSARSHVESLCASRGRYEDWCDEAGPLWMKCALPALMHRLDGAVSPRSNVRMRVVSVRERFLSKPVICEVCQFQQRSHHSRTVGGKKSERKKSVDGDFNDSFYSPPTLWVI